MAGVRRADLLLAGVLVLAVVLEGTLRTPGPTPTETAVAAAAAATLALRRSRPLLPLGATAVALVVASVVDAPALSTTVPALVAVYSAVGRGARAPGLVVAGLEAALSVPVTLARTDVDLVTAVAVAVGLYGIAAASGIAVGERRAVLDAARLRAERAEATRDVEAARRVAEERVRISRELHDVIGHSLAVISVQAGLADRLLTTRPEAARDALDQVQRTSDAVLTELGSLVRAFRDPGDEGSAPTRPVQGNPDVVELVHEARAAGLDVQFTVTEPLGELPPLVGLGVYRVVQESLTNARKHGDGRAEVTLDLQDGSVRITTTNALSTGTVPVPGGFGLVGLRERVSSLGGNLTHGVENGRFVLRAQIPVPADRPTVPRAPEGQP